MTQRNEWIYAFTLSVIVCMATLIPYLLANRIAEPLDFTGFLINPLDGHSDFVEMRQGESGSWLFQLMYNPQVSEGALIFVYYLLLGHIARWFGLLPILTFHAARIVISVGMFLWAYLFFYLTLRTDLHSRDLLYLSWILITALLLYAPRAFQRRLTLGLLFPLAGYAALGLERILARQKLPFALAMLLLIVGIPSNLMVIAAGINWVHEGQSAVVHLPGELAAYKWVDETIPTGSVVLTSPDTGTRLPAYSNTRVLYGHPIETPNAEEQESIVRSFFMESNQTDIDNGRLIDLGITYVFYGPRERVLRHPKWLMEISEEYQTGEV